ncbi:hypothetical protein F4677DRAFT_440525 [Hypoxylon crocopeplum]|nr:hypothetical protein F4677DRAFT_440525 [Hypoxylon crocopeplum]
MRFMTILVAALLSTTATLSIALLFMAIPTKVEYNVTYSNFVSVGNVSANKLPVLSRYLCRPKGPWSRCIGEEKQRIAMCDALSSDNCGWSRWLFNHVILVLDESLFIMFILLFVFFYRMGSLEEEDGDLGRHVQEREKEKEEARRRMKKEELERAANYIITELGEGRDPLLTEQHVSLRARQPIVHSRRVGRKLYNIVVYNL